VKINHASRITYHASRFTHHVINKLLDGERRGENEEEMDFWDTHSVTEFEAKEVTIEEILEELKHRSAKTKVTLYLETEMQNQLKALAAR